MGGGLLQLVAYGAQDVYLTGNPQITFFKVVYRRHTNFSIEAIEHSFTGTADFNRKVMVEIKRNGDLITKTYLRLKLAPVTYSPRIITPPSPPQIQVVPAPVAPPLIDTTSFAWVRKIGVAVIDYVECEVGGSRIDKQYGYWMMVWHELADDINLDRSYDKMTGDIADLTELTPAVDPVNSIMKRGATLFVPLRFWFCRNNGLALPLIALQYHEVRLEFQFRPFDECCVYNGYFNPNTNKGNFEDATLLVDYIYLDTEERRRFAQVGHEYLIEQLQFTGAESVNSNSSKFQLHFNHPVKLLIWNMKLGNYTTGKKFMAYTHATSWESARQEMAEDLLIGRFYMDADGFIDSTAVPPPAIIGNYDVYVIGNGPGQIAISGAPAGSVYIHKATPAIPYVKYDNSTELATYVEGIYQAQNVTGNFFRLATGVTLNNLTMYHLSRPVQNYVVDNRSAFIKAQDVVVYQHHNDGLFIDGTVNPVVSGLLQLNGHDRFDEREGEYFNYVQPWQHLKRTPNDGVNTYSFGLEPLVHQPSGTCNFSRIDTAQLNLWYEEPTGAKSRDFKADFLDDDTMMYIWAINYNVFRVMSGMGGLAYAS